ncbi:MAG: cysteine hydrolase [Phycisphaerae bacterium]|nr:cysteine hydrolase [Phycisphaerae bacterium]
MSIGHRRGAFEKVLLDLNTQCDYLLPSGAVPVANRAEVIPNVCRLLEWSRESAIPLVSSLNVHRPEEAMYSGMAKHCVDQTPGQRKLPFTLLPRRILIDGDNTFDLPYDLFRRYRQVIFAKRTRDLLGNPKADRLLTEMPLRHVIVFGVTTEHCVKATVLALLARHRNVVVVQDACGYWNAPEAEISMRQMDAKGAILMTTEQIVSNADIPMRLLPQVADSENGDGVEHAAGRGNGNGDGNGHGDGSVRHTVPLRSAGLAGRSAVSRRPRGSGDRRNGRLLA